MKHFSILLFSIFLVLTASFMGMILASLNQIGSLAQSTETLELNDVGEAVQVEGDPLFPQRLSGLAQQGANEYINLGCVQCLANILFALGGLRSDHHLRFLSKIK